MNYDSIIDLVNNSDKDDWLLVINTETFIYKNDVNLIIKPFSDTRQEFQESWIPHFPSPINTSVSYGLFYNSSPIHYATFVEVDSQRSTLPLPHNADDGNGLFVKEFEHKIATLIDTHNTFNTYFERTNLPIRGEE